MIIEKNKLQVLCFKTKKNHYIYDSPTNEILQVTKEFWESIQKADFIAENMNGNILREFKSAQSEGLFSTKRPQILTTFKSKEDYIKSTNSEISQLILEVTERCNLRCKYCTFSGNYNDYRLHGHSDMNEEVAHRAIDFFLERNKDSEDSFITFYGGEPTLNFQLIKSAVKYAEKNKTRDILYGLTTNGFNLSDEIIKFLIDNKFSIYVSLDGPQEKNDRYRQTADKTGAFSNTYDTLKRIRNIDENYFKLNVRLSTVIGPPYNIRELKEFFDNDSVLGGINLRASYISDGYTSVFDIPEIMEAEKINVPEEDSLRAMLKEYKENLINGSPYKSSFLTAFFESPFIKLHKRKLFSGYCHKLNLNGCCFPGVRRIFITPTGKILICEKVNSTLEIGDIFNGFDYDKIDKMTNTYISQSNDKCINCVANRQCSACFALDFTIDGFYEKHKIDSCDITINGLINDLIDYCEILEANPSAFDYMKDIVIS